MTSVIRTTATIVFAVFVTSTAASAQFAFTYDASAKRWNLGNTVAHASFQLRDDGRFVFERIDSLTTKRAWLAPSDEPSSPIRVKLGAHTYDASTSYTLLKQWTETPDKNTARQVIVLEDAAKTASLRIELEMYRGLPVLRHRVSVTNLTLRSEFATIADMLPYNLATDDQTVLRLWRVQQWTVAPREQDFATSQATLNHDGTAVTLLTGAHGNYCAWMALRDQNNSGLFAGWEFDGQAVASAKQKTADGFLQLAATVSTLHHPVAPGAAFQVPSAFIGLFQGDWDAAGAATQDFVERVLAVPMPANFPYVGFDSFGYNKAIDEDTLRRNADVAASLGIELFIVDLGWARAIGDWYEDPVKFPHGLRAVSDYVHSLGMKFGLHFALAEAAGDSQVVLANPDWTSSESYNYDGALSLCLSNLPAQQWLIAQAIRMIDDYDVDWIVQDGEEMVKKCTKTSHTHDPADSNYANSVQGINAVVAAIRRARPNVVWENCEDGGNMQTFNMVQNYVTSATNDASGALQSRQAAYGATYPFSPRYAERYMPEDPTSTYLTRSYMFGGPWHFMTKLAELSPDALALARKEIAIYKQIRLRIQSGKVFHLTSYPGDGRIDALSSYDSATDSAVAIVAREGGDADSDTLKISGLGFARTYMVHFQTDIRVLTMTGRQLAQDGVLVKLPDAQSAEIVYVEPLVAAAPH